jgi:hypothetical protein
MKSGTSALIPEAGQASASDPAAVFPHFPYESRQSQ